MPFQVLTLGCTAEYAIADLPKIQLWLDLASSRLENPLLAMQGTVRQCTFYHLAVIQNVIIMNEQWSHAIHVVDQGGSSSQIGHRWRCVITHGICHPVV